MFISDNWYDKTACDFKSHNMLSRHCKMLVRKWGTFDFLFGWFCFDWYNFWAWTLPVTPKYAFDSSTFDCKVFIPWTMHTRVALMTAHCCPHLLTRTIFCISNASGVSVDFSWVSISDQLPEICSLCYRPIVRFQWYINGKKNFSEKKNDFDD